MNENIYCKICKRLVDYKSTVPVCSVCRDRANQDAYTVIIPVTGYYEWSGIAESEEDALEKGEYEIKSDYEPMFTIVKEETPRIKEIHKDGTFNYTRDLVNDILEEYGEDTI